MRARTILLFVLVLTGLRWAWVAMHDVAPQEAYFWLCSTRLAPGFFDGPPGTALLVALCEQSGLPSLFLARMLWPALALVATAFAWLLAKEMFDERAAAWTALALNLIPAFNVGATVIGSAMPSLAFSLAGIWSVRRAWDGHRAFWLLAGALFAIATAFRYEAVLPAIGLIIVTLASSRHRARADVAGAAWVCAALALALWSPLRWNAALEWIPIAGGTVRTMWEFRWLAFPATLTSDNVSVIGLLILVGGGVLMLRDARLHERSRFLFAACGFSLAWWLYFSLRGERSGGAALLAAGPILVFLSSRAARYPSARIVALAVCLAAAGLSIWALQTSVEGRSAWRSLAADLQSSTRELPASESQGFFIAEDAESASILGWLLRKNERTVYPPVFVPESPGFPNQFGVWPSYADFVDSPVVVDEYFAKEQQGVNPFVGRHAIFLGSDLPQTIDGAFEQTTPLRQITMPGGRKFTIYLCLNYQTLPL